MSYDFPRLANMWKLYLAGYSLEYIGLWYGMSAAGVLYHFDKNNLPTRKNGRPKKGLPPTPKNPLYVERVKTFYQQGYKPSQIARMCSTTKPSVRGILKRYVYV